MAQGVDWPGDGYMRAPEWGRTVGQARYVLSARTDRSRCRVVPCASAVRWLGTLAW